MATVTGFTAERLLEMEANSIVSGEVVGDNLILTKQDESTVDAGIVTGGNILDHSEYTAAIQNITGVGSGGLADLLIPPIQFTMPNRPVHVRLLLSVTVNVDQKGFIAAICDMSNVVKQWAVPSAPGANIIYPCHLDWFIQPGIDFAVDDLVELKSRGAVATGATAGTVQMSSLIKGVFTADQR